MLCKLDCCVWQNSENGAVVILKEDNLVVVGAFTSIW